MYTCNQEYKLNIIVNMKNYAYRQTLIIYVVNFYLFPETVLLFFVSFPFSDIPSSSYYLLRLSMVRLQQGS